MNEEIAQKHRQALQAQQKPKQFYFEMFKMFSQDGQAISAIEFVKMCKLLKVYPVIIQFDYLKKIILKAPEYWHSKKDTGSRGSVLTGAGGQVSEIVNAIFSFRDFFKAFKIIAKIGYRNIEDSAQAKFLLLTQFLKKQVDNYILKSEKLYSGTGGDSHSETRSVKNVDTYYYQNQQTSMKHQYSNSNALQAQQAKKPPQQQTSVISPKRTYFENNQTLTPSVESQHQQQMLFEKRFSGQDMQMSHLANSMLNPTTAATGVGAMSNLSNDYRHVSTGMIQANSTINTSASQQRAGGYHSEAKSDISSRAYSTCVRNQKGKGGILIPKGQIRKKGNQVTVNSFLSLNKNFNTIQGKPTSMGSAHTAKPTLGGGYICATLAPERRSAQYKTIRLKDTASGGRNKSPSMSKSMNDGTQVQFIKNGETPKLSNPSSQQPYQPAPPLPQESQSKSLLDHHNPVAEDGSSSQRSFRIRKFTRSLSRSSRQDSARSLNDEEEPKKRNSRDSDKEDLTGEKNINSACLTIESPELKSVDISSAMQQRKKTVDKVSQPMNITDLQSKGASIGGDNIAVLIKMKDKYRRERDLLAKAVKQMQGLFRDFAKKQQLVGSGSGGQPQQIDGFKAETGSNLFHEDVARQLQSKDERIKALEAEVLHLRDREQQLVSELKDIQQVGEKD